ncbi:MAG: D-2-hydroxyacid dehydrogenase [Verrucomicrobia bacterium]|nr:D-2-hydroxyacid dehydrogenase [Verrucomicrobiota bacterium]
MIVVINAPLPKPQEERLRALSSKIELIHVPRTGEPLPKSAILNAEVIYTAAANFNPTDAPRLRWVQVNTAAVNHFMNKPVARTSIPIANVRGAYTMAVAECAMGMLLAMTRRIPLACRFQAERRWPEDYAPFAGVDLYGKTMGIVGYGSIGRQIARLAQAMGMTILACKRQPQIQRENAYRLPNTGDPEGTIPKAWFGIEQIRDMFRLSDVAMILLPLTPATKGLIGGPELDALPVHAHVVNLGRGFVLDEAALAERLRAGKLAGAALDVFANEPLEAESPLWNLPNVLIMPHIGSWTDAQAIRASEVFIENMSRYLKGDPLLNVIDKELMY